MEWLLVLGIAAPAYVLVRQLNLRRREARVAARMPVIRRSASGLDLTALAMPSCPGFDEHLAVIHGLLPLPTVAKLQRAGLAEEGIERSLIPGHKKGGTVGHDALYDAAPEIIAFYRSPELRGLLSAVVGEELVPTPIHDQSSCSLLVYARAGDRIGWHYDHNFYRGRHFTVLLSLENRRLHGEGLSSATLEAALGGGVRTVATPPNTLVVFEGDRVRHRVTPLGADERRVLLSMTFCTDPRADWLRDMARRAKDIAYYGPRALWA